MKSLSLGAAACLALLGVLVDGLLAQQRAHEVPLASRGAGSANSADQRTSAFRLPWGNSLDADGGQAEPKATSNTKHPLSPALEFAAGVVSQIHEHVHDYTCILIKRERIEDELQDFQTMRARVRCGRVAEAGRPAVPFSVFLEFLGPPKVRGRRVLFVEGENGNKMLARNGGKRFNYVIVKLNPLSEAAMRESLVPITEMGFESMTRILMRLLQENIQHDPSGANSRLAFYKNAKVNQRTCTRISVKHPQPNPELGFSSADVYVDDELHVPIRLEAYAWPVRPGGPAQLLFEYTYEDLDINIGLTSADFQPTVMQSPAQPPKN